MNKRERLWISELQKRADHLAALIANSPTRNLSYSKAELNALNWAIETLSKKALA